jgi:amino acid adenylation domain-containing protein
MGTKPDIFVRSDDLAYVIYTSGSTGRPKGAEITHSNLLNLVRWHNRTFTVQREDRASHLAGLGFDAAVWELWPYLAAGATVVLAPEDVRGSADALLEWLVQEKITASFVPTPLAETLIQRKWPADANLRVLLTGGDTLHSRPRADLPFQVFNNYGPTECTVVATSGPVLADGVDGLPSIGGPIDNTEVYILDESLNEVSEGSTGELCIAGAGVGCGYVGQNSGLNDRFLNVSLGVAGHKRIYRTGDLARRLPNGEIVFLGRIDEQIKIRAYRIEPAEIVRWLNEVPGIQASAVVATGDNRGDPCLIAYLVLQTKAEAPTRQTIQEVLLRNLPEYMVPAIFVVIEALPLNSNGKLDRSALPRPSDENMLQQERPDIPETFIQSRIQQIVGSLLGLESVDIHENFFLMGGHSLLGTQLIARLRDDFGVDLKLRSLFSSPTVEALSAEVEKLILANIASGTADRGQAASGM